MVTFKVLMLSCIIFCELDKVLLFNQCSLAQEPDVVMCAGHVWTEPAQIIPMGQNISINCHFPKELCKKPKLSIDLNNTRVEDRFLTLINRTTIQLHLQDFNRPSSTVACYASCPQQDREFVCGTQFCMGYLPDRPVNLTCFIREHSDNMTCTWDPGKETHLNTKYKMYLKSSKTEENKTFSSSSNFSIIPLTHLQNNQRFYIWVCAENYLGAVHSEPLLVDLKEIVTPVPPAITQAKTLDYSVFKTIIKWEKQSTFNDTHCEERYKEMASETWHVRELVVNFQKDHYTEYDLDANTKYEFQVRCKLIHTGRLWSMWSEPVTYTTPEAEPSSVLDVWRYLGPNYQNGSQEVTILIKPLLPKESRGKILAYRVFCENQGQIMSLCNTTEPKCKVLVPATVTHVYVTAQNSKGSSKPANITVNQQSFNYQDFPPPTHLKISDNGQKGISVMWEQPRLIGETVLWYIVEWTYGGWHSHYQHDLLWKKVPGQNMTTYIPEDVRMKRYFNISVYAVYHDGTSKACFLQSSSEKLMKKLLEEHAGMILESTSPAPYDDDIRILIGIGIGAAFLSFVLLALISKKSFRKRVRTVFISVMPKWLLEDYPQVQESLVTKWLQEKNSCMAQNFNWLFWDYEDAEVIEVVSLVDRECKALENRRETKEAVPEISLPETSLVNNSDTTEENGYKPQVFNQTALFSSSCETHSQDLDTKSDLPASSMNILIKDYMSPIPSMWPSNVTDENTFLLGKVNLTLSNGTCGQSISTEEELNSLMESQWKLPLSEDNTQEQTLIPNELLSCLGDVNENSTDLMSYFPQSIAK